MDPLPLLDLLTRARRSIALNFPQAIWVKAELSQINERRGHRYFQLSQKGEAGLPVAKCDGVVWSKTYRQVLRKRGNAAAEVLVAGQEVCLQVEADFHEVYGFKLQVLDWDPAFTIGQLELERRRILQSLEARGLLSKNKQVDLPAVVQRLAVLTSSRAAGYADFTAQLANNTYGYSYDVTLFDVSVQGALTEQTVAEAFAVIAADSGAYDAVLILRGGGSKLDLASFDKERIGVQIAECPLPVLVGIGHEIDETLPDLVAHTAVKTPTALAEFLIMRSARYEAEVINAGRLIGRHVERTVVQCNLRLGSVLQQLATSIANVLIRSETSLHRSTDLLRLSTKQRIATSSATLEHQYASLQLLDPTGVLKRGYAMISRAHTRVKSVKDVKAEDLLRIHLVDGTVKARVI